MRSFPTAQQTAAQAIEALEPALARYKEDRQELESAGDELAELRTAMADHEKQAAVAKSQADDAIRQAKGRETKEVVELNDMCTRKERQKETVSRMIEEQQPYYELCRIRAWESRSEYLRRLEEALETQTLESAWDKAGELFETPDGKAFCQQVPQLKELIRKKLYQNPGFMQALGVPLTETQAMGHPSALIPSHTTAEIDDAIYKEQMAAIGELVCQFITSADADQPQGGRMLEELPRLSYEAQGGEYQSQAWRQRRKRELQKEIQGQSAQSA